jgi:UDP-N-acetylmuramoylalanine--D-glutamate ligase
VLVAATSAPIGGGLDFAADGIVVAETSSFQPGATGAFRPRVAAVLNLTPDHLTGTTFTRYREARPILAEQTGEDWAI